MTTEARRSIAVVVLGAGRSGTSALTRGAQALGVDLGNQLRPPGGKNPTGFFEDQDLLALNQRLKRVLKVRGHSLRLIEDSEWQAPDVRALHQQALATIQRRFGHAPVWGYKYARTLRFLPFWQRVFAELDLDVRYVIAVRNPLSVARSRAQMNPQRGRQTWSDLEWLVNVVPYFPALRGRPLVAVDFDAMLAAPAAQLQRIAHHIDLPLTVTVRAAIDDFAQTFLQTSMRHSQFAPDELTRQGVHPLVCQAFALLHALAHDQRKPEEQAFWHDWQRLATETQHLAPVLRELDWLRQHYARARWNPLSPLAAIAQLWRDWRSR